MSTRASEFCNHCGLALGAWPHAGEVEGAARLFCCYGCFIGWQATHGGGEDATAAGFLIRLGVGAFLAMNIMLFSLLLYSGSLDGIDADLKPYVHLLLWVLATPVMVVLGGPFFKEAAFELSRGRFAPSLLIALGAFAGYAYSGLITLQGGDKVYFDTITMVLVLFTLGRYLEANGRARAARSLRPMMEAEQQSVRCFEGDTDIMRPLAEVKCGMLVKVMSSERIVVDGVVVKGQSQTEEALLTGEPWPVSINTGSPVLAGSMNGDGELLIEALADGLNSRWIEICRDIRAALSKPSRAQRLADRVAQYFVPVIILVALGASWANWQPGSADVAFMSGLAVLVVACPCALGLAAPLATSLAVAELAGSGIVIRSGAALETLAGVHTLAFDKTGTLTHGTIRCRKLLCSQAGKKMVLERAAAAASHSRHPLSRAICTEACRRAGVGMKASKARIEPGKGVKATAGRQTIYVGSRRWLEGNNLEFPPEHEDALEGAVHNGQMLTCVGWRGRIRGIFLFDDAAHPDAQMLLRTLEQDGFKTLVLTGDGERQTKRFCEKIGMNCWHAELQPNEKQDEIRRLAKAGPVAMIGDGVNDTPAMTVSAVGIAVGEGTELACETADIVLPPNGITLLPQLLKIARNTKRTIATNLAWAFGYNVVTVALAAAGLLQPVIAASLMAGSSVFVVINTVARLGSELDHHSTKTYSAKPVICPE